MSLLEFGFTQPLHVREERLHPSADACQVLYISDVHLRRGRSKRLTQQVIESVRITNPDLLLLGGDMLDQASELASLSALVAKLATVAPVLAVGGNHDRAVGMDRVRKSIENGGGVWIHDEMVHHRHRGRSISISGPESKSKPTGDVRIQCAHNPRIWKRSQQVGYDLVLAGHLHGCQVVAFEFRDLLFPGAIFYPYNYYHHQKKETHLIVSRGVSDLIPIRWRCPREVVLCHV